MFDSFAVAEGSRRGWFTPGVKDVDNSEFSGRPPSASGNRDGSSGPTGDAL
jgi:hypothetical protein